MRVVEAGGYTFFFTYDRKRASELHIELRTGVSPETAIGTFFDGAHCWNARRDRFECYTEAYGLYWTWLYGDETSSYVLVISCFSREDS